MKNIISFKLQPNCLTIHNIMYFYKLNQTADCDIYFYGNGGKTCKVNNLPRLISFLLTFRDEKLLTIIEGKDALHVKNTLSKLLGYHLYSAAVQ
ncbi:hypothetical protein JOD45_003304 [Scopulibacillus daqui]|uniref:HPr family phosphocarrier protein n=1 Tax=Scopulibacillus daqui TaxID=1469162 RepID=A0ABS2Q5S4_9BACL|nr:hypothetical protein [Scopulibacillus daqui]MBM7647059.1 hypothetical protein [Scopulibacillus daqui]